MGMMIGSIIVYYTIVMIPDYERLYTTEITLYD